MMIPLHFNINDSPCIFARIRYSMPSLQYHEKEKPDCSNLTDEVITN